MLADIFVVKRTVAIGDYISVWFVFGYISRTGRRQRSKQPASLFPRPVPEYKAESSTLHPFRLAHSISICVAVGEGLYIPLSNLCWSWFKPWSQQFSILSAVYWILAPWILSDTRTNWRQGTGHISQGQRGFSPFTYLGSHCPLLSGDRSVAWGKLSIFSTIARTGWVSR